MIAFWRETPLTSAEEILVLAMEKAHRACATRNNASTAAARNAASGSGSLECAIASALLAIGERHAPIPLIYGFLCQGHEAMLLDVTERLNRGEVVPGWGNSFFKQVPDPEWGEVERLLEKGWPAIQLKIFAVNVRLRSRGKMLYPNAGCYTAAVAIVLGLPQEISSYLLINARLPVWAAVAQKAI